MKNKLLCILTVMLSITICFNVHAEHKCEYSITNNKSNADVIITYTDDNKAKVSAPNTESWFKNLIDVSKYTPLVNKYNKLNESSKLLTKSVDAAQSDGEICCPEETYVCYGFVSSNGFLINNVTSVLEAAVDIVSGVYDGFGGKGWVEYDNFGDWIGTFWEDLMSATSLDGSKLQEVLIVSGSKADAKSTYGYVETGAFKINWDGFYNKENFDFSWYSEADLKCNTAAYVGNKKCTFNLNCPYLSSVWTNFEEAVYSFKACNDNTSCMVKSLSNIDETEKKLSEQCKAILAEQDYYTTDDKAKENKVNECISSCLDISTKIKTLKTTAGITSGKDNSACNLSEKLIGWIRNILKIIKYFVPVIVIVLSIIDFIKALGSEKEDEMKKAQSNFIKRLVAAALIFVVPFIIEFVLDKMGFPVNSCNIINL